MAGKAFNNFKRRCKYLGAELDIISIHLTIAATEEVAQQTVHSISEEWGRLMSCYSDLEHQYPEVRNSDPQEDEVPVCMEREVLYEDHHRKYVAIKVKATNIIAKLRIQVTSDSVAQPDLAQMITSLKDKRIKLVMELKRRMQILQVKANTFVVSAWLLGSSELESLYAEIRRMWKTLEEMSDEIKTTDPARRDEISATQLITDDKISDMMYPLELKIAPLITSCKEAKERADTMTARAAWSRRLGGGLGLEILKFPSFTGRLADYPSFKEDWDHGNLVTHLEMIMIRDKVPEADKFKIRNLKYMTEVWSYLNYEYGQDKLAAERIDYLYAFQYSKLAQTNTVKFRDTRMLERGLHRSQ